MDFEQRANALPISRRELAQEAGLDQGTVAKLFRPEGQNYERASWNKLSRTLDRLEREKLTGLLARVPPPSLTAERLMKALLAELEQTEMAA